MSKAPIRKRGNRSPQKQSATRNPALAGEIEELYDNTPFGFHSLDENGVFIGINNTELSWLGYSREEILGKKIFDVVTPEGCLQFQKNFPGFKERGWIKDVEVQMVRKDGSILPVLLNSTAIKGPDGSFLASRTILFDITTRKQAEQALQRARDGLERRVEERTAELRNMNQRLLQEIERREKYEQALVESEQRYRAFITHSTEGVVRYEAEKPVPITLPEDEQINWIYQWAYVAECNNAFSRMYGWNKAEDLTGFRLRDTLPQSDPRSIEVVRGFIRSGYRLLDVKSHQPDRQDHWRCFSTSMLGVVENGYLVRAWGVQRDITEQEDLEQKIRNAAEEWQTTFDSIKDLVLILDPEFRIVRVNASAVAFFGLPLDRILGSRCHDLMHGTSTPIEGCPCNLLLHTKKHEEKELHCETRAVWLLTSADPLLDEQGNIARIVHTLKDITARKQAEKALQESEVKFRTLFESNVVALAFWRKDGQILDANDAFLRLVRFTREELKAGLINWRALTPPEFDDVDRAAAEELRSGKQITTVFEKEYLLRDGRRVPVLLTVSLLPGYWDRGVMFVMDLSERRQAEIEAQRLRQELTHVARFAVMGQLTAALAHELNQPLTAILSNAQAAQRLLGAGTVGLEELSEILSDIAADGQRAGEVIRRLRALLKKEKFEFHPLKINDLVHEVVRLLRNDALMKKITVTMELAPDLPMVRGDRIQLEQVILNLAVNAFEAMQKSSPPHRNLVLRTRTTEPRSVQVEVCDSGVGIPPDKLEGIFEPFFTSKTEGMGMGLAICRSIMETHGGRIWATNNLDHGATFWFMLPVSESANP